MHLFLHAGVSDDEFSLIQDIVADKLVEKIRDLSAEFRRFLVQLLQRIREPVRDLYVFARSLRISLISWLPGTQRAVPAMDAAGTEFSRARLADLVSNLRG